MNQSNLTEFKKEARCIIDSAIAVTVNEERYVAYRQGVEAIRAPSMTLLLCVIVRSGNLDSRSSFSPAIWLPAATGLPRCDLFKG